MIHGAATHSLKNPPVRDQGPQSAAPLCFVTDRVAAALSGPVAQSASQELTGHSRLQLTMREIGNARTTTALPVENHPEGRCNPRFIACGPEQGEGSARGAVVGEATVNRRRQAREGVQGLSLWRTRSAGTHHPSHAHGTAANLSENRTEGGFVSSQGDTWSPAFRRRGRVRQDLPDGRTSMSAAWAPASPVPLLGRGRGHAGERGDE